MYLNIMLSFRGFPLMENCKFEEKTEMKIVPRNHATFDCVNVNKTSEIANSKNLLLNYLSSIKRKRNGFLLEYSW